MAELNYPVQISIIIPCLNEESTLPLLIQSLSGQKDINFELVICDGGSTDGTLATVPAFAEQQGLSARLIQCEKGRGKQLNAGVDASYGEYLLFLHADSSFDDPLALNKGVSILAACSDQRNSDAVAGHFALRFSRERDDHPLGYYFYECKARLDRRGCTHGDQGLMIRRSFFHRAAPFPTFPPMLAETLLAERIRGMGEILLLPAEILTSARRFETEGLYQRQVLNAILMNCAFLGWEAPFSAMAESYRSHTDSGKLHLAAFLDGINKMICVMPFRDKLSFWYGTGKYVRLNAWQLAFFLDVRRDFMLGLPPGGGSPNILEFFDRRIEPLIDNQLFRFLAMLLTWIWFQLVWLLSRRNNA